VQSNFTAAFYNTLVAALWVQSFAVIFLFRSKYPHFNNSYLVKVPFSSSIAVGNKAHFTVSELDDTSCICISDWSQLIKDEFPIIMTRANEYRIGSIKAPGFYYEPR